MEEIKIITFFKYFLIFFNLILSLLLFFLKDFKKANSFGIISFYFLTILWALRFYNSKHFPFFGAYESSLSILFFTCLCLYFTKLLKKESYFFLYPLLSLFFLIHSSFYSNKIWAMTISERSFFVYFHAIFAYIAFGLNFLSLNVSILKLFKKETKINLINSLLLFFFFYTLMFSLGVVYRFFLFGKFFSFDPMESIHLFIFLIYTTLIHNTIFYKWEEKKLAKWVIFCFLLFLISYRIILLFPPQSTYHIIDIEKRLHIKPL